MPRLLSDDGLIYQYGGKYYGLASSRYSSKYLEQQYQNNISTVKTVSIELTNMQRILGTSRVFIIIVPGECFMYYSDIIGYL